MGPGKAKRMLVDLADADGYPQINDGLGRPIKRRIVVECISPKHASLARWSSIQARTGTIVGDFCERGVPGCSRSTVSISRRCKRTWASVKRRGLRDGCICRWRQLSRRSLVRCSRGSMFDVVLDLRPESSSYRKWYGVELSATNARMLFVPENCAHGYQTLEDNTEMHYTNPLRC
jgi:hypothetical protein